MVLLLALVGAGAAIFAADIAVREGAARATFHPSKSRVRAAAYSVASFPSTMREVLFPEAEPRGADQGHRLAARPAGWTVYGKGAPPPGYLLLSRIDGDADKSVVELVDLKDFSVLYRWEPVPELLMEGAPTVSKIVPYTQWANRRYRALHPLLMPDGSLVFGGQFSPLFRLSACGDMVWRQDSVTFHHSVTVDAEGGFWGPTFIEPSQVSTLETFREDALTRVDANGQITMQRSLADILIRHGHSYIIYQYFNDDPLHTNDIEPVFEDGPYWKKGDLFVSMRHPSVAMLYRPSTDEIVWFKQGPWLGQHDIDIIDDHTIAIFNNNYGDRGRGGEIFGNTDVMFYDFATDQVTRPYEKAMGADLGDVPVLAVSNGLMDFAPSGHMFVEEDTSGRILVYAPDRTLWAEYINRSAKGVPFRMSWSRYVPADTADAALQAISACDGRKSVLIGGSGN
ncbi:hypothetical protein OU426_10660 [Frigidibacter sp. RF13]|nr:hypothetical protein [Frigidibacter sp. RF13]